MRFDKNSRIILLIIYAVIMFITIQNELNTIIFILLFAVTPISVYFFVKKNFPNNET